MTRCIVSCWIRRQPEADQMKLQGWIDDYFFKVSRSLSCHSLSSHSTVVTVQCVQCAQHSTVQYSTVQ